MTCDECSAEFPRHQAKQRFCCRKCSKRFHKRLETARNRKGTLNPSVFHPGTCKNCPAPLPVPRHYQQTNCERCKKYGKPEKRRQHASDNRKRRRAKDKGYVMRVRLSGRLREMCSKRGIQKSNSITVYLGCTPTELMAHIERQFTDGMTWESYGVFGWHIDHHLPCAMFDLPRGSPACLLPPFQPAPLVGSRQFHET
jgi:hypothetical protein